jgi:phosphoserine phosphatase
MTSSRALRALLPALLVLVACQGRTNFGWSPEVLAVVDATVQAHRADLAGAADQRPLAVFDFDNTTVQGDVAYEAIRHVARTARMGFDVRRPTVFLPTPLVLSLLTVREGLDADALAKLVRQTTYTLFQRYRWLANEADKQVALTYVARLFSGWKPDALRDFVREAWEIAMPEPVCVQRLEPEGLEGEPFEVRTGLGYRPGVRWMMDRLRAAGFDVWIVSASPKPVVEVGAAAYGVPADHVIGTRLKPEPNGALGIEVVPPIPWRQGKQEAIEALIGRKAALVFGDSWTDVEMLSAAEHGVLMQSVAVAGVEPPHRQAELEAELRAKGTIVFQPPLLSDVPWAPCR